MSIKLFSPFSLSSLLISTTLLMSNAGATIVEFHTSQGNFKVNLHDQTTPATVANFLKYVNDGDYNNTVIHRVVPSFVVQGGGFSFAGNFPLQAISIDNAVKNEPFYSNVRGTIAMAKKGGNANSATSQWFVNINDNSKNLDEQNGGFTVFGEVISDSDGNGMSVVDAIADLPICSSIPMPNYTNEQCRSSSYVPGVENFVTIEQVTIVDSSTSTADSLTTIKNTKKGPNAKSSGSGGALSWLSLLLIGLIKLTRKVTN